MCALPSFQRATPTLGEPDQNTEKQASLSSSSGLFSGEPTGGNDDCDTASDPSSRRPANIILSLGRGQVLGATASAASILTKRAGPTDNTKPSPGATRSSLDPSSGAPSRLTARCFSSRTASLFDFARPQVARSSCGL